MTSRALRRALLVSLALAVMALVVSLVATYVLPAPPPPPSPSPTALARALLARIVVSLPRAGARRAQTDGIANAVRLAVEEANARVNAGDVSIALEVEVLDSGGADGAWNEAAERANVDRAANDRSVVAYVGPGTLEGAKLVATLAGSAGLLVVTPTLTHPALTRRGYDDPLYDALHPGGANVFVRTIPSDEVAARAMLRWAIDRRLVPVAALGESSWATAFALAAKESGAYQPALRPRFLYVADGTAAAAGDRVASLRQTPSEPSIGGPESLLSDAFLRRAGKAAEGIVATFAGRPTEQYSGSPGAFFRAYRDRFLIPPDPYAIFGYDAARLVFEALRRSRQGAILDRAAVREAAFAMRDLDGALGPWSVDARGDTTYATLQLYSVKALPGGAYAWVWEGEISP